MFYDVTAMDYAIELSRLIDANKAPDTPERTPKRAPKSWWLDEVDCPAMYAECFFMTNKTETALCQEYLGMEGFFKSFEQFHRGLL